MGPGIEEVTSSMVLLGAGGVGDDKYERWRRTAGMKRLQEYVSDNQSGGQ